MKLEDALDCVYFTADTHWNHANIIKYCNRPFDNMEEMGDAMVINWNAMVKDSSCVYHLGDVTLAGLDIFAFYMQRLIGQIFVLPGSHDGRWLRELRKAKKPVLSASGLPVTILDPLITLEFKRKDAQSFVVVLCHYAMRAWDRSHYGSSHLYGHSHGMLLGTDKSMDVGVDCNDFTPVSLRTVVERLT